MLKSLHSRARTVAVVGIAAALAVAGVAFAQGGNGTGGKHGSHRVPHAGKRMPPPPGGPMGRDLTYAQFHVQRNGHAEVQRLDRGEIVAVDSSSITLRENDGSEVTISLDESTRVLAGPGKTQASDLETGQEVLVAGPEGGTAKAVIVPPKPGQKPHGARQGQKRQQGHMPPPPGAPFGAPQGAPSGGSN